MKRNYIILACAAAALLISSCAKISKEGKNDAAKRYFDAWMKINHPEAQRTEPGIYIIDDKPGSGVEIGDLEKYPYAYIEYTVRGLDGTVTTTNDRAISQQIGKYSETGYYGPTVLYRSIGNVSSGLEAMLSTMRVGGERTAVVPGWLNTRTRYNNEEEYLKYESGDDAIYTMKVVDAFKDAAKWQIDSIENYLRHHNMPTDSTTYGFYYIQTQAPEDTSSLGTGVNLVINYTGSLLNGQVFDTTNERIAKDNGVYNSARKYEPMTINVTDEKDKVVMDSGESSSDVIVGFARGLARMKKGEKGIAIFISDLGYQDSGSTSIPGYAPLRFDLEMVGLKD